MVSRKKARGKARKAAKKAKAEEEYAAVAPFSLGLFKDKCTHGWNYNEYAADHDCYKLIAYLLGVFSNSNKLLGTAGRILDKYPEIESDATKLEWIASAFVSIGVEAITEEYDDNICAHSVWYSDAIYQHVACRRNYVPAMYKARLKELLFADKRRLIGYLKKRIPCSCLDSIYSEVKHLPKNGRCCSNSCSVFGRKVELSKMWSCEDCRRQHYCSKECQADDWPRHKEQCKVWSEWEANGGSSQPSRTS